MKTSFFPGFCLVTGLATLGLALLVPENRAAENDVPLPDLIVLKEGASPPSGTTSHELAGAIVEEDETTLKVELSKFRGISNLVSLPKSSIESIKRGDHAERDYFLLKPLLQMPETSATPEFYEKEILIPLDTYLAKYPNSPRREEASAFRSAIAAEIKTVREGDLRFGSFWIRRKELSSEYRTDLALWHQVDGGMVQSPLAEFKAATQNFPKMKTHSFYPYLVEKGTATASKRVQYASESGSSLNKNLPEESAILAGLQAIDTKPLKKAVATLARLQQASAQDKMDAAEVKALAAECRLAWPDLDSIDAVLLQAFKHHIEQAESLATTQPSGEKNLPLKNAGELLLLIKNAPATLAKDVEGVSSRQTVYQLMKESRQLLESGKENEAIARINRVQQMIPPESPLQQPVQDIILQATDFLTNKGLAESRKEKEAGRHAEALAVLRKTETSLLSYKALDTAHADLLANECIDLAIRSAKSFHLITAVKASWGGWAISPTNIHARISCIVVFVSLVVAALVFLMTLLLVFSQFSNVLHKQRFDLRLESLRADEKARRANSARRRKK